MSSAYAFVSDTLIYCEPPEWELSDQLLAAGDAVCRAIYALAHAIKYCSNYNVALRGAVSYGRCLLSGPDNPILIGKPFQEASEWEHRQQWMAGILAPSAARLFARALSKSKTPMSHLNYILEYKVPLKEKNPGDASFPLYAADWINVPHGLTVGRERCPIHRRNETNNVREKLDNTRAFCNVARARELAKPLIKRGVEKSTFDKMNHFVESLKLCRYGSLFFDRVLKGVKKARGRVWPLLMKELAGCSKNHKEGFRCHE